MGYQQLVALAGINLIVAEYLAFELYKGHVGIEFADVENLGAVYIFIWIVFQQVTIRVDAELLAQYLFLLGSYPGRNMISWSRILFILCKSTTFRQNSQNV